MRGETSALFNSVSVVFIGRVLWGTEIMPESIARKYYDSPPNQLPEAGDVHFAVEETFKGNIGNYVVVHLEGSKAPGIDCDKWYLHGERLIVYAYGQKNKERVLRSNACILRVLDGNNNNEELKFLRNTLLH